MTASLHAFPCECIGKGKSGGVSDLIISLLVHCLLLHISLLAVASRKQAGTTPFTPSEYSAHNAQSDQPVVLRAYFFSTASSSSTLPVVSAELEVLIFSSSLCSSLGPWTSSSNSMTSGSTASNLVFRRLWPAA